MSAPIDEARLVSLFRDLCLIDAPALAERDCVAFVRSHLEGMGLEVWEDQAGAAIGGNANNLAARLPGNTPSAPKIFFSAHFDTVEPTRGLEIVERDGALFSDGSTILGADDKAGMAPAIEAVRCLMDSPEPRGDVFLVFTCAEEIGLLGAGAFDIGGLGADFGYVFDTGPPVGSFVTQTATHDKLDFEILGRPAHAGKDPEHGLNAISVLADAVSGLTVGRVSPETTCNLGIVEGGTAVNVVCPSVRVRGEARSTVLAELESCVDTMVSAFESAARKWGAELKVDHKRHYDAYTLDPASPVVRVAQRAARGLGMPGDLRKTLGGSDANVFNAKGVPTAVVGTGMEKIHTHEEFVRVADLVSTARLAVALAHEAAR